MNAQVQALAEMEIVVRLSLPAAETMLEGLSKLPIDRAHGLYMGLRNAIDDATTKAIAPKAPAPPPAPTDNNQQPNQETQPT